MSTLKASEPIGQERQAVSLGGPPEAARAEISPQDYFIAGPLLASALLFPAALNLNRFRRFVPHAAGVATGFLIGYVALQLAKLPSSSRGHPDQQEIGAGLITLTIATCFVIGALEQRTPFAVAGAITLASVGTILFLHGVFLHEKAKKEPTI